MEKGCGLLVSLLCLLSVAWRGVNGEEGEPVLKKVGKDALMQWKLPEINQDIVTIVLKQGTEKRAIFMGSVQEANMTDIIDKTYKNRLSVFDTLKMREVIFTLRNVSKSDAGRFICIEGTADIPIIDNCGQMLVIVDKPNNCSIVASSAAVENEDLTLECTAITTSLPLDHGLPMQVQWFDSEGTVLTDDTEKAVVQGNKLLVRSIQRNDKGLKYSCRTSDGLDIWSDHSNDFTIIPEYGPTKGDIDMPRSEVAVAQSESMQQQCSAQCNPPCTVSWRKKKPGGKTFYTVNTVDALLDFPSTTRNSGGEYHCVAKNKHGTAYRTLQVVIRYPSSLEKLSVNGDNQMKARLNEGDNVTIRCEFDSNPAPTVRWFSHKDTDVTLAEYDLTDQTPVVTDEQIPMTLYTSQFFMQNVQCSDTGLYVCKGENSFGFVTQGEVQLDVVCVPRNTHGDLRLKQLYLMPANNPLFIRFQLEGYPRANIVLAFSEDEHGNRQWVEKEHDYTVDMNYETSHPFLTTYELMMPSLTPDHFDRTYYFRFKNNVGIKDLAFKLRERGAPKPPKNFTSIWTDTHRVHLRWLPGFHGGKPQTFTVHYHMGDPEENQNQLQVSVPAQFEETLEETPKEMTVDGLTSGTDYTFYLTAENEYGNTTSSFLKVTTLATAAAGTDGGAIAGAVIGVILVIVIICIIVFVFVIRPRRQKAATQKEDSTREPMLTSTEDKSPVPPPRNVEDKQVNSTPADTTNNNADLEPSSAPPVPPHIPQSDSPDNKKKNQDGLIYADLDLDKSKEASPVPERKDAVNYETIVFTPQPQPPADADDTQLVDEEQPPKA